MERFKRAVSLVLCMVMVLGFLPVSAFAAETVLDAAIFCSDVHGSTSDLTNVLAGVATSNVNYSSIGFVGDTCLTVANTTSTVQSALGDTDISVMFSYAESHDTEDGADIADNWDYSGEVENVSDYYLVYTIRETDMQTESAAATAAAAFTNWYSGLTAAEKSLPIFIMSHRPMHERREGCDGGAEWYDVISAAAETSDIVFFWAHNHTGETSVDTDAYYVEKDGSETVKITNGDTVIPNFTYMNAGYINANGQNPARINVATTVQITEDSLIFQDYNSSGTYSGTYAHNVEVAREFANTTDSGEDGSTEETTAPTEGEEENTTVTYNYTATAATDGTGYILVSDGYALQNNDGTIAAVAVTVSDDGSTITFDDSVDVSTILWTIDSDGDIMNDGYYLLRASGSGTKSMTISTTDSGDAYSNWTYADDTLTTTGGSGGSTTFYAYCTDGTFSTQSSSSQELKFYVPSSTTGGDSGSTDEGEDDTTGGSTETVVGEGTYTTADDQSYQKVTFGSTTTEKKTVYVLTSSITSGTAYLIANSNSTGSAYVVANNSGSVAATGVTVVEDDTIGTYIELTDATDELWTTSGSSSTSLKNGNYYLTYSGSRGNYSLDLSTSSASWTYSSNRLSIVPNRTTYYLVYDSGWDMSSSSDNVYFYVPTEVEVTVDTTKTYAVTASDIEHIYTTGAENTEKISASVTDGTPDGFYAYEVVGGDNIITSISEDGVITFNGAEGTAQVKVSYTWTDGETTYTIWQVIDVTTTSPYYTLEITKGDSVVSGTTISQKGVTSATTMQLGTQITFVSEDGTETLDSLPEGATLTWTIPEEYQNIAAVDQNGLVSFKGVDGAFYVTATLSVNGKDYTTGVNISATTSQYSVPTDGVTDFPEYPNEGAIRYDKTATAVGNFSETGIAQVELSMTGVPYTTGSEIDVVIMLDMTGSMSDTAMTAAEESAIAFAGEIVKNDDGSYNNNRIAVLAFNSGTNSPYTYWSLGTVSSDAEWTNLCTAIRGASENQVSGGTPYDEALSKCREILQAAKTDGTGNGRSQFCVFVSDGGPTSYEYITNYDAVKAGTASSYSTATASATGGSNQSDSNFATIAGYTHEYYSTLMKDDGVTMYSVLTGLSAENYPNCTTIMQNIASEAAKAYVVEDGSDTSAITDAFTAIAMDILQAATDVTVEDQITDEYTMIFDIPEGSKDITGVTNDFYIEFGKYALDEEHERTDFTSVTKLYLQNTNGTLSAKDADAPVFEQTTIGDKGTLYYWSTNASDGDTDISVTVSDTTYYFVSYGLEEPGYNMTSGAYAYGTVDSTTNMSTNLVIATPYFVYNASTKMLYWTVDKLDTNEYVLRYFLYLDNSATEVATDKETDPGSYPTNDHAYITYTNFNGNDCRQEFPIPQLTWSGAQVSYVFYLVNAQGQPINKSGQVVDFANATFVTDIYTEHTVWNKGADGQITADSQLGIDWLAQELLPSDYMVYDEDASYKLHVYGSHTGESIFDYFIIGGSTAAEISASLNTRLEGAETTANSVSVATTKVYNTKAGQKITGYGTYTSEETNSIDNEIVLSNFDFYNTTVAFAVVWQPKLVPDVVVVDYGLDVLINVVQNDLMQNSVTGIGTGNAAYGNTAMNTGVSPDSKLGTAALTIDGNTISLENENQVRFSQGDMLFEDAVTFYYESPVKYFESSDAKEGYMYSSVTVIPATTIYYEDSFVTLKSYTWNYDAESEDQQDWIESTNMSVSSDTLTWEGHQWTTEGTSTATVQDTDRPGDQSLLGNDANNLYGYDSHYTNCSTFSMGSAAMINVDYDNYGAVEFSFAGTGFDVISMTSNKTGTIAVTVYDSEGNVAQYGDNNACKFIVDTYYGYARKYIKNVYTYTDGAWTVESSTVDALGESGTAPENPAEGATYTTYTTEWYTVDTNDPNSLYQVPIMKVGGLTYGTYRVVINAMYDTAFDHDQYDNGSFDFYLDAIRIYDPANDGAADGTTDTTIEDAYKADGEYLPEYYELRNWLISRGTFDSIESTTDSVEGIVFIDGAVSDGTLEGAGNTASVADYSNYGPNNELYLAPGQAVAFNLDASVDAPDGYGVESVQIGLKSVGNTAAVKFWSVTNGVTANTKELKIGTATDLYYDITNLDNKTVVIMNSGTETTANAEDETVDTSDAHAILSITNVKVTFKEQETSTGTDTQSIQNELQTASFGTIGAVQTCAVAAAAETEAVADENAVSAPFTVSVESVELAIASMNVSEEKIPEETEPEVPETTEPETTEPETTEPETTEPETTEPETTEPETTEPEATEPEATEPEATEPETTEPETTEPETTEPEATEPEETEPEDGSEEESGFDRLIGWLIGLIDKIFG